MNLCKGEQSLPLYVSSKNTGLCHSSLPSESSSVTCNWSDVCSQASDDTTSTSPTSADSTWSDALSQSSENSSLGANELPENEPCCYTDDSQPCQPIIDGCGQNAGVVVSYSANEFQPELPPQFAQNPRRTSVGPTTRTGCPPALINQEDRKVKFVDNLVGKLITQSKMNPVYSDPPSRFLGSDRRSDMANLINSLSNGIG